MRRAGWVMLLTLLVTASAAPVSAQQKLGRSAVPLTLHPAGLARLIDEVGGQPVVLPRARVLTVVNPRALLIESDSSLAPAKGEMNRVLVLVDNGALTVAAADVVGASVRVAGIARTLLGAQVTREVPWPPELTADTVKRLEIRAAVLASSVHTADGVELTARLQ